MLKRILTVLLCLFLIPSFGACSSKIQVSEETKEQNTVSAQEVTKTAENSDEKVLLVSDPLTWEKIDAIPIASSEMTEEQLRQICVDYYRLQLSYQWTPSQDFRYEIDFYDRMVDIKKDQLYIGSPYDYGHGNLYKIMNRYDPETGILSVTKNGEQNIIFLGNHCSSASHWGWSRVSNTFHFTLTHTITEANGAIKIGPYKYPNEGKNHVSTKDVCATNGQQIMFQSYAALKPADGVVCYNNAGHVMMVSSAPNIVYLPNGEIDGENSYILVLEQVSSWEDVDANGESYSMQGRVDKKYTFNSLYKSGYLPFTLKELIGQDPVEKGTATLVAEDTENLSVTELSKAKISSNYEISDITVKVLDKNGDLAYSYIANCGWLTYEKSLSYAIFPATLSTYEKKGGHKLEILCRIGTGELITVYSGELV